VIPELFMSPPRPDTSPAGAFFAPPCPRRWPAWAVVVFRFWGGVFTLLVLVDLFSSAAVGAQDQRKPKVPVIDKIASGGSTQQLFIGTVKSVDLDSEVLYVDNINGKSTEIFPIKKKVHVSFADGVKLKLAQLKPGTLVNVYYDQKGDRRTVTAIEVVASSNKKKAPPS